jgi:uncharacterized protein with PIN domain
VGNAGYRFAADRMLGRLVKWLRIIGEDVLYGPHLSGYGLLRAARMEERLVLTRDRKLRHKQPASLLLIESDHYRDQLRQVVDACGLKIDAGKLFSRCLACNSVLQPKAKEAVKRFVPAYVFSTQENFVCCPTCHRIYWPATHHARMIEELKKSGIG